MIVVGWDGAAPRFAFEEYARDLPALSALRARGSWGPLRSCRPPITVPAWACAATGRDPGGVGLFGFRNRAPGTREMRVATSLDLRAEPVWETLSRAGRTVALLGVPPAFPPPAVNGVVVSDFLAPDPVRPPTHPPEFGEELRAAVPGYRADAVGFRAKDREALLAEILAMVRARGAAARHILRTRGPDLLWLVEIGVDRAHHAFWSAADPGHPAHRSGDPLATAIRDVYRAADEELARILAEPAARDAAVIVLSDHGGKASLGSFRMNDWLRREGFLVLSGLARPGTALRDAPVDWDRTRAWAAGGYYGRVYANGADGPRAVEEIRRRLAGLAGPDGRPIRVEADVPAEVYRGRNLALAPDLLVYVGDLSWRVAEGLGHEDLWTTECEVGADDAVHDWDGIAVASGGPLDGGGRREDLGLCDVAPTILKLLGQPVPGDLDGNSWI
ncbi:MAG: alkaline phosphatase family protein [Planctomycetales bacterium]|nr:alkaline phosphatase family protein [Planctomycetales bacterium]